MRRTRPSTPPASPRLWHPSTSSSLGPRASPIASKSTPGYGSMTASDTSDTIVAIATPPGQGGIGVVRLSGGAARAIANQLCRPSRAGARLRSHHMVHGLLRDPHGGAVLDEAL